MAAVVQVNREREVGGERTVTSHYYITSYAGTAAEFAGWVRGHWGIENGLHWVLDVVFREDGSRVRAGHAGANLAMIRRVAVSLLRRAPGKGSGVTKRLKAGWDDELSATGSARNPCIYSAVARPLFPHPVAEVVREAGQVVPAVADGLGVAAEHRGDVLGAAVPKLAASIAA